MPSGVSVVIPAWNAGRTIGRCLEAIHGQTVLPLETIVVDDCSNDCTASVAERGGARVLRLSENRGPALARNMGARAALGDIVLFLDADVIIPDKLLETMVQAFTDPSVAAVQTLYSPECPGGGLVTAYQNFYYHYSLNRLSAGSVAVFATWCAAVRRDVFMKLGGFNESIPEPTVEDEEFGYAIADSGGVILLDKSIQVVHLAEYSLGAFSLRRLRMAVAQSKSGWRQVRQRLLARYMNVHETGTHHSRWVVLSILLTLSAWFSLPAVLFTGPAGLLIFPGMLFAALLCHAGFFISARQRFGTAMLPGFAAMCIADMTILGFGIIRGTLEFLSGKKY